MRWQRSDFTPLAALVQALNAGRFDRILLTGMGASYYGLYPAWLHLAAAGLPAIWVDTAELVHHAPALVTGRTLLWISSQSGRSAEIVALLRQSAANPPAGLIAMTNDLSSPLAQACTPARGSSFEGTAAAACRAGKHAFHAHLPAHPGDWTVSRAFPGSG